MAKEILEKKIAEQIVCPDCGKATDYKDIDNYKRGLPAELMEMDFRAFLKQKTGIYEEGKRRADYARLAGLSNILLNGKLYKEIVDLPDDKYTVRWHEKKIEKVKDLYSLTKREIFGIQNIGKVTWDKLNATLENNNLAPLKLPYGYTVTYPLKKYKK
ncbi:MAG: hypothetical protein PHN49_01245 [Candidatus Omnitrophica bacterium]|nr:hypothetical protein [Candidatus Omnitrophota bacterium]